MLLAVLRFHPWSFRFNVPQTIPQQGHMEILAVRNVVWRERKSGGEREREREKQKSVSTVVIVHELLRQAHLSLISLEPNPWPRDLYPPCRDLLRSPPTTGHTVSGSYSPGRQNYSMSPKVGNPIASILKSNV